MGFEPTCTALQAAASPLGHSTRDSNPTSPKTYPSGRRDSNPRPSPWQGDALPLSHVRTAEPRPDLSGVFRRVTDFSRRERWASNRTRACTRLGSVVGCQHSEPDSPGPAPFRGFLTLRRL